MLRIWTFVSPEMDCSINRLVNWISLFNSIKMMIVESDFRTETKVSRSRNSPLVIQVVFWLPHCKSHWVRSWPVSKICWFLSTCRVTIRIFEAPRAMGFSTAATPKDNRAHNCSGWMLQLIARDGDENNLRTSMMDF